MFESGSDVKAEMDQGGLFGGGIKTSLDFDSSNSSTSASSTDVRKTAGFRLTVNGPASDGIDHDADLIYLWLNPQVNISIDQVNNVAWRLSVGGPVMNVQFLYVSWLKQPQLIPPGVQQQLTAPPASPLPTSSRS